MSSNWRSAAVGDGASSACKTAARCGLRRPRGGGSFGEGDLKKQVLFDVDLAWFAKLHNLADHEVQALLQAVPMHTLHPARANAATPLLAFSPAHWAQCVSRLLAWLAAYHEREPDSAGARVDELRRALPDQPPMTLVAAILDSLVETKNIVCAGSRFQLCGHEVKLTPVDLALWERVQPALAAAGLAPPRVGELAMQVGARKRC